MENYNSIEINDNVEQRGAFGCQSVVKATPNMIICEYWGRNHFDLLRNNFQHDQTN